MYLKILKLCILSLVLLSSPLLHANNSKIIDLTDENFDSYISEDISIVDFYYAPCSDCQHFISVFENVAMELGNAFNFYKLEISEASKILDRYMPSTLPTVIIFIDGEELVRWSGFCNEETLKIRILEALKNHLQGKYVEY